MVSCISVIISSYIIMAIVHIKQGHVQPIWSGHPWVFAGAIKRIEGPYSPGDGVDVVDPTGKFLGRGFISPNSAITVRILTRNEGENLDEDFLNRKISSAIKMRKNILNLPSDQTTGFRLINSEGDGLGGLIVDIYDESMIVQFLTIGMKKRENEILDILRSNFNCKSIYEVESGRFQKEEGIKTGTRHIWGIRKQFFEFKENSINFLSDIESGQKTGFYFDQRDNRVEISKHAVGKRILDLFSYTASFSIYCLLNGAKFTTCVDTSMKALMLAERNFKLNRITAGYELIKNKAHSFLTEAIMKNEKYDVVVVDPPNFAYSSRDRESAKRAYRRVNSYAMKVVKAGGILATSCCSGQISTEEFLRILAVASGDARLCIRVIEVRGASSDHPFSPAFQQGRYLKFAICEIGY